MFHSCIWSNRRDILSGLAFLGGYFVAKWLSKRRQVTREEMLRMQYGQVLTALASAMQGGLMHYQALEELTPVLPQPSKDVFTEILARARTGSSLYQATKSVAEVVQWKDLESMAAAFKMYEATGCNLVEVFNYLADVVRERESDRKYVSAVTRGGYGSTVELSAIHPYWGCPVLS